MACPGAIVGVLSVWYGITEKLADIMNDDSPNHITVDMVKETIAGAMKGQQVTVNHKLVYDIFVQMCKRKLGPPLVPTRSFTSPEPTTVSGGGGKVSSSSSSTMVSSNDSKALLIPQSSGWYCSSDCTIVATTNLRVRPHGSQFEVCLFLWI